MQLGVSTVRCSSAGAALQIKYDQRVCSCAFHKSPASCVRTAVSCRLRQDMEAQSAALRTAVESQGREMAGLRAIAAAAEAESAAAKAELAQVGPARQAGRQALHGVARLNCGHPKAQLAEGSSDHQFLATTIAHAGCPELLVLLCALTVNHTRCLHLRTSTDLSIPSFV
jgi:hypothetical protein